MRPGDPNLALLEIVADQLGDELREQVVFVGGAVAGLLITDPAMPAIRPTDDVDLIVEVLALSDYHRLETGLRERGFEQDLRPQAPICRWRAGPVAVDVMPTLEHILGFSNRWYPLAIQTALWIRLPSGKQIRQISAPAFIATKLEAFDGRGNDDYLFSHDLGDLLAVIDGRATVLSECRAAPTELRDWLAGRFRKLLATSAFVEALPGHLPPDDASQERLPDLLESLRSLTSAD